VLRFVVGKSEAGERPDRALRARYPQVDRRLALMLLKAGRIVVDGEPARLATRLAADQRVDVAVAADRLGAPAPILDVVFEGEGVVVVDKPAGVAMHAGTGVEEGAEETLASLITARFDVAAELEGPSFLGRLDRATSGLAIALLDRGALAALEPPWRAGRLQKEYLVVVHGEAPPEALIEIPLAARGARLKGSGRREDAVTELVALASSRRASLVLVEPKTGRTHQIRRHMKAIGHPVVGDARYGDPARDAKLLGGEAPGLLLHAWRYRHRGDVPLLPRDVVAACPPRLLDACAAFDVDATQLLDELAAQPLPDER